MMNRVETTAPAKANLFLRVLAREQSGYHQVETLFCRLALADRIAVDRQDSGVTLAVTGADTGDPAQNLAVRAAEAVLEGTGRRFGVHIALDKRIPVGAGLGGGSSDAASTLVAVNQLAGNPIPRHELLQMGARLGADVPFFISGASLALGWGRGDRLFRLPRLPTAPALLVVPAVRIDTTEAYGWLAAAMEGRGSRGAVALDADAVATWGDVARMAGNDFESVVFGRRPAIRAAFEALVGTRPLLCRLSGSGSALLGVYRSARDRDDAAQQLGPRHGELVPVTASP